MAKLVDQQNPSFALWPCNNNRTAWRPFGLPIVLVVPHRRAANGAEIPNTFPNRVRIAIEGAPTEALVAGFDHVGLRFPDRELYSRTIFTAELLERQINISTASFKNAAGDTIDYIDAKSGDLLI